MKDSGIEWIGEIPEGWEVLAHKYIMHKEKSICEHYSGEDVISLTLNGVVKRDLENPSGKMPTTFDGYQFVDPNDLLLCLFDIDVTPRCVGLVKDYGVTSPAYSRFKIHSGFCNAYYNYLLRFIDDEKVFVHLSKNLRSSLTESDFGAIKTIVPSKAEQQRIADYLDNRTFEIDILLSKARSSIEEYKKLKQAVITQAVTKGVRGEREMKDSGVEWIGMVPKEWTLLPFRRVLKERNEKNTPIKSTERLSLSIELGVTLYSEKTTNLDRFKDDFEQYKLAYKGDLVMNSMNMIVGATGVSEYFGCVSPVYYTFYDDSLEHVTAKYCEYIFRSKTMLRVLYSLGKGIYAIVRGDDRVNTCRLKVSKDDLKSLIVPVPSLNEQREIVHYLNAKCAEINGLIAKKEQLVKELESYKKSLIYEVVTGKREVFTDITRKFPNI